MYHGTNSEFWTFDIGKSGKNFGDVSEGLFFFTNKKNGYQDSASDYAKRAASKGGNERIIECYLDIKKPLHIYSDGYYTPTSYFDSNAKAIYGEYLRGNYDGIIIENSDKSIDDSVIYMLDDPSQIKSATDNIGTFDRNNPDIRYQQRAKSEETLRAETAETILRDKYNVNVGKLLEGMDSMLENYKGSKSRKELEADILEAAVKTNEFSSGEGSFKHMSDAIESLTDEIIASSPVLTTEIADDNAVEAQRAIKEMRFKVSHGSTVTKDSMQRSIKTILILCRWDSDIIFAVCTREANITRQSRISRHSNTSRREMNITEKSDCKMQSLFSWRAREDSNLRPIGS